MLSPDPAALYRSAEEGTPSSVWAAVKPQSLLREEFHLMHQVLISLAAPCVVFVEWSPWHVQQPVYTVCPQASFPRKTRQHLEANT